MKILGQIMSRYATVYAIAAIIAALTINWPSVQDKRSRYLQGIFYNGYYKNCRDGAPYVAYMRRVKPDDHRYQQYLTACPQL